MEKDDIIPQFKPYRDSVHGFIDLSNLMVRVMNTREFQRLRKLKQLGACYVVYANATHTRFEHSVGTAFLAGKLMEAIMIHTPPSDVETYMSGIKELRSYYDRKYEGKMHIIDTYIIELVKLSALCHDLGHGPFSHIYDDFFLPMIKRGKEKVPRDYHEVRSGDLLEKIIKRDSVLSSIIMDDEITFMKNLINPRREHTGFIYQIVSNGLNGLDVDKYDYLARDSKAIDSFSRFTCQRLVEHVRVIDNTICYPQQAVSDVIELFQTRYNFHKTVYSHPGVISAQYMITEIFSHLDPVISLSSSVSDLDEFCKMTDEYVLTCPITLLGKHCRLTPEERDSVVKAEEILERYDRHDLYAHVETHTSKERTELSPSDFKSGCREKILVYSNKIGLVSGSKTNPLDSIFVYRTKDIYQSAGPRLAMRRIDISKYSRLVASDYQEYITMVFYKDRDTKVIEDLRQEFHRLVNLAPTSPATPATPATPTPPTPPTPSMISQTQE